MFEFRRSAFSALVAADRFRLERGTGLAGAAGSAVSNLLGMSYITGAALRYRVYSSLGLEIPTIAGVLAIAWTAFWLGMMLVLGLLLILHPAGLSTVLPIDETL